MNDLGFYVGVVGILIGTGLTVAPSHPKSAFLCFLSGAISLWWWAFEQLSHAQFEQLNQHFYIYLGFTVLLPVLTWIGLLYIRYQAPPIPNLVCLGEEDIFAELASPKEVFIPTGHFDDYRLCTAVFQNLPKPPRKIAPAEHVTAEIYFLDPQWTDKTYVDNHIERAVWLKQPLHEVSFGIGEKHVVNCCAFEPAPNDGDGHKNAVTFFEHPDDPYKPMAKQTWPNVNRFHKNIRVDLKAGLNGQYGGSFDFELRFEPGSFTFEYISPTDRKVRRKHLVIQFDKLLKEAEQILPQYQGQYVSDLNQKMSKWRDTAENSVMRHLGYTGLNEFTGKKWIYWNDGSRFSDHEVANSAYTNYRNLSSLTKSLKTQHWPRLLRAVYSVWFEIINRKMRPRKI